MKRRSDWGPCPLPLVAWWSLFALTVSALLLAYLVVVEQQAVRPRRGGPRGWRPRGQPATLRGCQELGAERAGGRGTACVRAAARHRVWLAVGCLGHGRRGWVLGDLCLSGCGLRRFLAAGARASVIAFLGESDPAIPSSGWPLARPQEDRVGTRTVPRLIHRDRVASSMIDWAGCHWIYYQDTIG